MYKTIRTPLANLYKNHSFKSEQVSQALMGENVKVLDSYDSWYKIEQWDYYESWVHSFYLVDYLEKSNDMYFFDNHTNELICDSGEKVFVPFGVSLPKLKFDKNIVTVLMPSRCTAQYIIPDSKIFNSKVDRLIYNASKFTGVHYHWGGISTFGCDCSGFVQTLYKSISIELPRDSSMQFNQSHEISLENVSSGDLLFFSEKNKINHVAIAKDNSKIIHCSGYVKEESIDSRHINFNASLMGKFHGSMTVEGLKL